MDTREALLKAVLAAPGDDLPRLVFADHLEENGEAERAEFIRVQCELHKTPGYPAAWDHDAMPHVADLHRRKLWLLNEWDYHRGWRHIAGREAVHLIPDGKRWHDCIKFRRGFIHTVRATLADWLKHGPAVVREHPVTKVVLTDREPFEQTSGGWVWVKQFVNMERHMLTPEVFDTGHVSRRWPGGTTSVTFATSDEATVAASAALIQWAKSQPV